MADLNLPILDLSQLDAGPDAAARFRDDLRAATHDVGFFYLTGTGVSPELEARLHRAARDFFALPEADKLAIENVKSPHFRGYTRIGGERTQGKVDWREQIDIGPERDAITDPEAPDFARLIGPNLWPDAQPELREVVVGVARPPLRRRAQAAARVGARARRARELLRRALRRALDPHQDRPLPRQGGPDAAAGRRRPQGLRRADAALGRARQGRPAGRARRRVGRRSARCPARSSSTSASCWSTRRGGYLIATKHRVISPRYPDDRISVPFFFNPALDKRLPLIELPAELAAEARGVTQDPANPIHALYGENALKSRLRAHPDVAEIHHADLVAARAAAS